MGCCSSKSTKSEDSCAPTSQGGNSTQPAPAGDNANAGGTILLESATR